jgi:hypothetical protein
MNHSFEKLLRGLEKLAVHWKVTLSPELKELLVVWHEEDHMGMVARYPVDRDNKTKELQNTEAFDLKALVDECEGVLQELSEFGPSLQLEFEPRLRGEFEPSPEEEEYNDFIAQECGEVLIDQEIVPPDSQ